VANTGERGVGPGHTRDAWNLLEGFLAPPLPACSRPEFNGIRARFRKGVLVDMSKELWSQSLQIQTSRGSRSESIYS